MMVRGREVGMGQPTYVIAELGTNHRGDLKKALELVETIGPSGVDAVKFQAFTKDELLFCPYEGDEKRIEYWNTTVMSFSDWGTVADCCHDLNTDFILSVFQPSAMALLEHCDAAKVASRAVETFPYDRTDLPLFISLGMVNYPSQYVPMGQRVMLNCVSDYPTDLGKAMAKVQAAPVDRGISDHSGTIYPGMYAITRRLPALEVHVSPFGWELGRDSQVEIDPRALSQLMIMRNALP